MESAPPPPSVVRAWANQEKISFGPITLHMETRWVEGGGKERRLSYALFCILVMLLSHQGQPVSLKTVRDYMIARGKCLARSPYAYRAHIGRLREELAWITEDIEINNVFDRGYVIAVRHPAAVAA